MVLTKEITITGSKGERRCRALFDSGADYSIIKPDIAESVAVLDTLMNPENWGFETGLKGSVMQARHAVRIDFRFDDSLAIFSDEFIVLPGTSEEIIIGALTMQKWNIKLDFEADVIHYSKEARRLRIIKVSA